MIARGRIRIVQGVCEDQRQGLPSDSTHLEIHQKL